MKLAIEIDMVYIVEQTIQLHVEFIMTHKNIQIIQQFMICVT